MTNQARFTINSLLEGKSAVVEITPVASEATMPAIAGASPPGTKGLGLEIANIAALPDAEDYAKHEFYAANFTPSEIAYCTQQHKAKAVFQTLLAAKRAVIKSGAAAGLPDGARGVEISFDADGRPAHPGCVLSISHTDTIAAAVCFWPGGLSWPAPAAQIGGTRSNIIKFPIKTRIFAFLVLLSLLVLFALGLWKVVEFARH
jgi:phosphopantetheinyl transferase (holo-ACP synthase)